MFCIRCFRKAVDRLPTLPLPKGIDLRTDGGNATRVAAVADSGPAEGPARICSADMAICRTIRHFQKMPKQSNNATSRREFPFGTHCQMA